MLLVFVRKCEKDFLRFEDTCCHPVLSDDHKTSSVNNRKKASIIIMMMIII